MEKDTEEVTRERYLEWRNTQNKDEILRAYFNLRTGYGIDYGNFMIIYLRMMDEAPGLEEDIEKMYPNILHVFDKLFNIVFVTKQQQKIIQPELTESETVLIQMM